MKRFITNCIIFFPIALTIIGLIFFSAYLITNVYWSFIVAMIILLSAFVLLSDRVDFYNWKIWKKLLIKFK